MKIRLGLHDQRHLSSKSILCIKMTGMKIGALHDQRHLWYEEGGFMTKDICLVKVFYA